MLGGSRRLGRVPTPAVTRLIEFIEVEHELLVGDAAGIDAAFQQELASRRYKNVLVFTSLPSPRNNLGNWAVKTVATGLKSRSAAMHTVKDREMVRIADCGLMIWDCESPGTLANMIDFVESGKSTLVWIPGDELLWELNSPKSLSGLLTKYPEPAAEARKRLRTYRNRLSREDSASPPTLFETA